MLRSAHFRPAQASARLAAYAVVFLLSALILALPSALRAAEPETVGGEPTTTLADGAQAVAGEVLVGYSGQGAPQSVPIPETANPEIVAEQIEKKPEVRYAVPNYIATTSGWLPNDNGMNPARKRRGKRAGWRNKQWNFLPCLSFCHGSLPSRKFQSRGGMNVIRAWQHLRRVGRPGAAGVKVAVLDTGVAYRKFGKRFRRNPDLGAGRFVRGFDFVQNDRFPLDLHGHGTHVASTIGQQTGNRKGLTGIAYRSRIMPVRVMDANGGGNAEDIAAGIRWASRHGARVITMSLNFACGVKVPPVEEALRQARRKGVVLVGSSGNIGSEFCPSLPATAPEVISVGGTTESGCVANYSFESEKVDIAAPGGGQSRGNCPFSARNRPILQVGMIGGDPSWFGIEPGWIGTSMAAAHVAGAAAAVIASGVLGKRQGPGRVTARLLDTARLPAYARGNPSSGFGAGIVNLGRATNRAVKL